MHITYQLNTMHLLNQTYICILPVRISGRPSVNLSLSVSRKTRSRWEHNPCSHHTCLLKVSNTHLSLFPQFSSAISSSHARHKNDLSYDALAKYLYSSFQFPPFPDFNYTLLYIKIISGEKQIQ